jgi:hypothetical protein
LNDSIEQLSATIAQQQATTESLQCRLNFILSYLDIEDSHVNGVHSMEGKQSWETVAAKSPQNSLSLHSQIKIRCLLISALSVSVIQFWRLCM